MESFMEMRGPCHLFPKVLVSPRTVLEHQEAAETGYFRSLVRLKGNNVYFLRQHSLWRITTHFMLSYLHCFYSCLIRPSVKHVSFPKHYSVFSPSPMFLSHPSLKKQQLKALGFLHHLYNSIAFIENIKYSF